MEEAQKLIEYTEVTGTELYIKGSQLVATDGKGLGKQHKRLLKMYKSEILQLIKEVEGEKLNEI